ncbi:MULTISPECIES: hypothetical protein [unclassified Cupriavidus]|uniref:hypothetical protein n=1 Tax=Cupriavidus sp. H19C3 TaxID=3241603 RepID=UPI003BF90E12
MTESLTGRISSRKAGLSHQPDAMAENALASIYSKAAASARRGAGTNARLEQIAALLLQSRADFLTLSWAGQSVAVAKMPLRKCMCATACMHVRNRMCEDFAENFW